MNKRGQISIYVILAIALILVIGVVYYLVYNINSKTETPRGISLKSQAEDVKTILGKCFEDKLLQALYIAGMQGGHLDVANPSLNLARGLNVGYGYFLSKNEMPKKEDIELEMSEFLNFIVPKCLDSANLTGFTIVNISGASTRINIYDDHVEGKLSYPVVVSKADIKYTYDDLYSASYNIRFGMLHKFSQDVINYELKDPNFVPLSFIDDFTGKTGAKVDILDIEGNTDLNLYVVYDEKSSINGIPYIFEFANKFK